MRKYIADLLHDVQRVEVRTLPDGKSATFTDAEECMRHVAGIGAQNVYTTINRPKEGAAAPFGNDDIDVLVRLPFDFDPVRPTGTASTQAEHQNAVARRDEFVRSMASAGWPHPLIGDSGNGGHAVYRVFLRHTPETAEMLRSLYAGLAARWSDDEVIFDRSVRNAGRIWRLYGTVNRKGVSTAERPYRQAVAVMPENWQRVPLKLVERMANSLAVRPTPLSRKTPQVGLCSGAGDYRTLDVVGWFEGHGAYLRPLGGHVHEVICPWESEHSCSARGDTVIFEADGGWPGFFCHHAHCADRRITDVMAMWGDADRLCAQVWEVAR